MCRIAPRSCPSCSKDRWAVEQRCSRFFQGLNCIGLVLLPRQSLLCHFCWVVGRLRTLLGLPTPREEEDEGLRVARITGQDQTPSVEEQQRPLLFSDGAIRGARRVMANGTMSYAIRPSIPWDASRAAPPVGYSPRGPHTFHDEAMGELLALVKTPSS